MIWLRKVVVHLLSLVLFVALVGGVASLNLNRNFANPAPLERWLANSGIYSRVTTAALQQTEKASSSNGDSGTVSLSDPAVQQAAASAFSPELVQREVNAFLDGNYDWLSGKKAAPDFNIDLSSAKETFAKGVGQAAQAHLASLPACTPQQLAQLPIPVDPLTITCRPATLDPAAEGDRVAQEINSNSQFLANPVISANTLNQQTQSLQSQGSQPQTPSQPYYKKLSWAPKAYQVLVKLPWVLGVLALLCILGIVFIAPSRRRGFRRLGWVFLLSGLILVGLKFLADAAVSKFANLAVKNAMLDSLKQPLSDFLRQTEPQLVRDYLLAGIVFVVVAATVFVLLFRSREQAPEPKAIRQPVPVGPPATAAADDFLEEGPAPAGPQDNSSAVDRIAPRHRPTAPSLGKNPPRRKPPKLIQ